MQRLNFGFALVLLMLGQTALGSVLTNGVDGINVPAGLNGSGITIGQVEPTRPGDPSFDTNGALFNSTVDPQGVFFRQPGPPIGLPPNPVPVAMRVRFG